MFSSEGRKEAFSIGRRNVLRMSAVKALRELARQAVPIDTMLNERGMTDIKGVTHVVAPLEVDGEIYAVRLALKELTKEPGKPRFYTFAGFEIAEPGAMDRGGVTEATLRRRGSPGSTTISIDSLIDAIKERPAIL